MSAACKTWKVHRVGLGGQWGHTGMLPSSEPPPQHNRQQQSLCEGLQGQSGGAGGSLSWWGPRRALASSPIFKAECKALVIECGPPNSVPWGSVADGSECLFSLALCSFPRVLTHFVVIRYRCFAQLSLKIQVYCEIEVSL